MKKYFISINKVNEGPFTLEELQSKNLSKSDLVWTEELGNWTEVSQVAELKDYIKVTPPPAPNKTEVAIANETKFVYKQIIYGILIGLVSFPIYYFLVYKLYTEPSQKMLFDFNGGSIPTWQYENNLAMLQKEVHDFYLKKSFYNSFYIFLAATGILLIYRYITKSVKWVKQNSTN